MSVREERGRSPTNGWEDPQVAARHLCELAKAQELGGAPEEALALLPSGGVTLRPGGALELPGVTVEAVPAYNLERSFFPRERGWLGYVIRAGGRTYYHAGATDRIPEMREIRADVAFLPVSDGYAMDEAAAREAAADVGAATRVALLLVGDRFRKLEGFVTGEAGP